MNKRLIRDIEDLEIKIGDKINKKLKEFPKNFYSDPSKKFLELCFCILVANTSIEKTQIVWKRIYKNFLSLSEKELKRELKNFGYRFYNKRADYIISDRRFIRKINSVVKNKKDTEIREWLVKNIKGISWKESSHFLRNLGFTNFAILDRHVLRFLLKNGVVSKTPKTLTRKKYLEIEEKLRGIARSLKLSLAELDLYLFYLDTGRICKK